MIERLRELAAEVGFECIGEAPSKSLTARPEVRDMCAADTCQQYDHSWACPPACGPIEEFQKLFDEHDTCLIFQSVGELEDEFDFETMAETADKHKERFFQMVEKAEAEGLDATFLTAGTCTICKQCTYPDEPCRFPERRFVSMEAAGLVVSEACTLANIPYNHGKNTLAYSSCALV